MVSAVASLCSGTAAPQASVLSLAPGRAGTSLRLSLTQALQVAIVALERVCVGPPCVHALHDRWLQATVARAGGADVPAPATAPGHALPVHPPGPVPSVSDPAVPSALLSRLPGGFNEFVTSFTFEFLMEVTHLENVARGNMPPRTKHLTEPAAIAFACTKACVEGCAQVVCCWQLIPIVVPASVLSCLRLLFGSIFHPPGGASEVRLLSCCLAGWRWLRVSPGWCRASQHHPPWQPSLFSLAFPRLLPV